MGNSLSGFTGVLVTPVLFTLGFPAVLSSFLWVTPDPQRNIEQRE